MRNRKLWSPTSKCPSQTNHLPRLNKIMEFTCFLFETLKTKSCRICNLFDAPRSNVLIIFVNKCLGPCGATCWSNCRGQGGIDGSSAHGRHRLRNVIYLTLSELTKIQKTLKFDAKMVKFDGNALFFLQIACFVFKLKSLSHKVHLANPT